MSPDLAGIGPIIGALIAGGAVTFYTARPRKNTLIAEAADKAVDVVTKAIDRQEILITQQATALRVHEEELRKARDRIVALETELRTTIDTTAQALRVSSEAAAEALRVSSVAAAEAVRVANQAQRESEARITALRREVERLGGDVDRINGKGKQGPPGDKGPRGDPGPHG